MHKIIALIGPSGVGKSVVEAALADLVDTPTRFHKAVSVTTRPPRTGEVFGIDYYFVSVAEFGALALGAAPYFAEIVVFGGHYYGLSCSEIAKGLSQGHVVVVVEPSGARQLRTRYGDQLVSIYLKPPEGPGVTSARMRARGDSETAITRRLVADSGITPFELEADHVVVAYYVKNTVLEVLDIVCGSSSSGIEVA